jgi:hypothetical protein
MWHVINMSIYHTCFLSLSLAVTLLTKALFCLFWDSNSHLK